jgi:cytochrome c oxidase assembly protein subunit 15
MIIQTQDKNRQQVGIWLLVMALMVFAMVVVGGATRLTESGLSMVNWNPVTGALPPLSEEAWQQEFSDYKTSPEYNLKNHGMSLEDFKGIFYWEWGHRLLGRLIGIVFFIPMVWFWARRQVPEGYKARLVALFILGGSQGVLGWYMVMSGLVDEPTVSHYRLTAHLMLALFIFAALLWTALSLLRPAPVSARPGIGWLLNVTGILLTLQLIMGALVAGLKAGYIFNTWPLMGETFVPPGLFLMEPVWRNLFDNAVTVQFDHRIGAYVLTVLIMCVFVQNLRAEAELRRAAFVLLGTTLLQMTLGIIMLMKAVPVSWGTAHQGGGVLVLAALINIMHLRRREEAK